MAKIKKWHADLIQAPKPKIYLKPISTKKMDLERAFTRLSKRFDQPFSAAAVNHSLEPESYLNLYNQAVYAFNHHPLFSRYKKLRLAYKNCVLEHNRLEKITPIACYHLASQQDYEQQFKAFLRQQPLNKKNVKLSQGKLNILQANGILSCADLLGYSDQKLPNIGPKTITKLYDSIIQFKNTFNYQANPKDIEMAIFNIQTCNTLEKMENHLKLTALATKINTLCAALHRLEQAFARMFPTEMETK